MMRARWLFPVALLALVGCTSMSYTPPAPSPPASPDSDAQAKQFAPPAGKGNVYIARTGGFLMLGQATPFSVTVDGKEVGGITPGMYYCFALEPGNHNLSASSATSIDHVTVGVEAGKNYFYQISTSTGANSTERLSLGWVILEPMGKLMIQNNKRGQASIE